ncbi:MAG: hypothetical protein DWQ04_06820 [Chloroflexi bacterium]|nr:MAG: hypothetical protein DWQ04_06820 [Chloroflexota bacterium]
MDKRGRGYVVALFGPDGSGKSTVADLIEETSQANGLTTARFHWRPRIFPGLKNSGTVDTTQPDQFATRSWVFSVAMHFYIFFDFVLGWFFRLRSHLIRGNVVVYERYFYDLLFHPRRYKLARIPWLSNFLAKIVPKPQFIVLLTGDPNLIYLRKPELPLEEIVKQQALMKNYLGVLGPIIHVDTTTLSPIETTVSICEQVGLSTDILQKKLG